VEKYGTTRTLSRLINEKLRNGERRRVGERTSGDLVERAFGSWKIKETGVGYVKRLRRESERRIRRIGVR